MAIDQPPLGPAREARLQAELPTPAALPRVSSRELLGDSKEVLIEHHGAWYRLRETSLGKLILTK